MPSSLLFLSLSLGLVHISGRLGVLSLSLCISAPFLAWGRIYCSVSVWVYCDSVRLDSASSTLFPASLHLSSTASLACPGLALLQIRVLPFPLFLLSNFQFLPSASLTLPSFGVVSHHSCVAEAARRKAPALFSRRSFSPRLQIRTIFPSKSAFIFIFNQNNLQVYVRFSHKQSFDISEFSYVTHCHF